MTSQLRLIALSLITISCLGTSCTSLQQTTVAATDDLYYAPNNKPAANETAASDQRVDQSQMNGSVQGEYQDYQSYPDDRYLRLKVANRHRWDAIDDFGYWNDPRYNYAYYPSYGGWNSWYSGFYGSSWYNPFSISMGFGWGGYAPFMNSYYSMGWGFNDFGYGYGGLGYGGFGFGYGYGGWNPYYASYWNPYAGYYNYYGGYAGGMPARRIHYQDPRATRTSVPGLTAYRNVSSSRNYNNTSNVVNGNTRYTGNANLNNNFGSLLKRVVTNNANTNFANSWDRPSRSFSNNNNNNQVKVSSSNNNSSSSNAPTNTNTNSNSSGRSGGFNSTGSSSSGGRAPRSH
jgi:uncharacterized membrane protein YgcG